MKRFHPYRLSQEIRDKHAEVIVKPSDLILPCFVVEGRQVKQEIKSLTGVYRYSSDILTGYLKEITKDGIGKIMLFGVIDESLKDDVATAAYTEDGLIPRTIREIKAELPSVEVFTDVCLCGYSSHGHCGLVAGMGIDNDSSLNLLARMAVVHAKAGADFVCPSAMMDGQVAAIRKALNQQDLDGTKILSYSLKYASALYGPFREAAASAPAFGDRKQYQMDFRTIWQGVEEALADIEEGADWLMVKPAHTYLDMIRRIKQRFPEKILAAYHVSGEYMLIKAASSLGYADENAAMTEVLTAIRRAGADLIITYYAAVFAERYSQQILNQKTTNLYA